MNLEKTLRAFAVAAEPTRLKILELLFQSPYSVSVLAQRLGISVPLTSLHLKKLKDNGIVAKTKVGTTAYYQLNKTEMSNLLNGLLLQVNSYREANEEELQSVHSNAYAFPEGTIGAMNPFAIVPSPRTYVKTPALPQPALSY